MSTSEPTRHPNTGMRGTLLDAVVAANNGDWLDVEGYEKKSIEITIATPGGGGATATVYVSNAPVKPANTVDHVAYGTPATANALVEVKIPVRWIKVKVTAVTAPVTVSAYIQGTP